MYREKLHGRDSQALQVFHGGRMRDSRIGTAQLVRDFRHRLRETLDVGLVNDGPMPGSVRTTVVRPVEERVDDDAPWRVRRAIEIVSGVLRGGEMVRKDGFVPVPQALDGFRVWLEQQLGRVAPQPLLRSPRSMHAVPVTLAGFGVGQVAVPA